MMNRIRHNYPSPIQCLRAFHIFTFPLLLLQSLQNTKNIAFTFIALLLPLPPLSYYFATKYFAEDIKLSRCGAELTTHLLILENILWLPLCRINKFGLNTLPSKAVAIR